MVDERGCRPSANGPLRIGGAEAPAIADVAAEPEAITERPAEADTSTVSYRLTAAMNITVTVTDAIGGVVAALVDRACGRRPVRTRSSSTAPHSPTGATASCSSEDCGRRGAPAVGPAHGEPHARPRGRLAARLLAQRRRSPRPGAVIFSLSVGADVRVRILRDGRWVATLLSSSLLPGVQRLTWDGMRANGPIRDGVYSAVVEAEDEAASTTSFAVPFARRTRRRPPCASCQASTASPRELSPPSSRCA